MNKNVVRRRWLAITAPGALVLVAALWLADHGARAANPVAATASPPVVATTAAATLSDVPIYRAGIGTVSAAQSVTVKARIDGQLDKVAFVEGQDVKAGQLLARIDPRTLQAQLAQAQAQRARDEAQLNNARVDLQRYVQLMAEEASTQQQLDTQRALVAQLEAAVKTDDAQINYAQVQLDFTNIVAPISGRLGARLVDQGNIVHASDAGGLVVINQIDPIALIFTLPEENFQDINQALRASTARHEPLSVQAYTRDGSQLLGTGKLILLNNQIDTANGTVQLKALFANPAHTLWPGQYVNARLLLGQRQRAVTIPAAAVQRSQDSTYVYAVAEDTKAVRIQPIRVAQIQDGVAVIDDGLSAGQRVVVDGQYKLKPGATIVEAAPRKAGTAASGALGSPGAAK